MNVLNTDLLRGRMAELDLRVTDVAALTGLSRQTIHTILKPGFDPIVQSVAVLSSALGLDLRDLLRGPGRQGRGESTIQELLDRSALGDARAFELLPAVLVSTVPLPVSLLLEGQPVHRQLGRAAAEVANLLSPCGPLRRLAALKESESRGCHGFFFGLDLMTPARIVQATPEPLSKHLVFGAFSIADFARHL